MILLAIFFFFFPNMKEKDQSKMLAWGHTYTKM